MKPSPKERRCDVLILGAGQAGSCLARQLRLQQPDLSVTVVDRRTTFDWWVGESMVETWVDYMTRVLDLGDFVRKHFVPKNGLRFLFDSAERDLPLARMSEMGRGSEYALGMQIDRSVFDREL